MFSNTLVALPTGLGKTFIAAVVMYNYFRWFPEGNVMVTCYLFFLDKSFIFVFLVKEGCSFSPQLSTRQPETGITGIHVNVGSPYWLSLLHQQLKVPLKFSLKKYFNCYFTVRAFFFYIITHPFSHFLDCSTYFYFFFHECITIGKTRMVVHLSGLLSRMFEFFNKNKYLTFIPTGKIVFAAPSRPLVMQQIEACHNIGGIPQVSVSIMHII